MARLAPLLLALLLPLSSAAQPAEALSDSARASLLTMLPGDQVYSLFGHSAFRIADPATGLDRTYNYGTFDFEQPFFILRFTRGQLDYLLDTAPFEDEWLKYAYLERPIVEQHLALPPETVRALYTLLETNALPENRTYRYDFFFDNCSTRLLDKLDEALAASGQPRVALAPADTSASFRNLIAPYIAGDPLLRFGIDLGLGRPADRPATRRERTFLPILLLEQLDAATVAGQSLVAATDTVLQVPGYEATEAAFPWPLALTSLLLAVGLVGTVRGVSQRRQGGAPHRIGRRADALLFGIVGVAGLILLLLWLGTEHRVTGPNLNLLWAWPTHLAAAWALRREALPEGWRVYLRVASGATLFVVAVWAFLPQALPLAAWPLALLTAVRAFARSLPLSPSPAS